MLNPWVGEIPWKRKWQPTPVFLPGEFRKQRSLACYSPQGHKESDATDYISLFPVPLFAHLSTVKCTLFTWLCEASFRSYLRVLAYQLNHIRLFATPWTVAYQVPPSVGFSRQEYWSGLPFSSPGDLPNPGIEPGPPAL